MATLREQPRLAVAKLLALVAVALAGGAVARALEDDSPKVPPETAAALERAERSAQRSARELRAERTESGQVAVRSRQAAVRSRRVQRRLRAALARERRLRLALRRARRRLARQD